MVPSPLQTPACSLFLPLLACCSTLAHAFQAPAPTDGTARTEPARILRADLGVGGTTPYELGVVAGLRYGLTSRVQLGTNLAHAGLGMLDLFGKATLWRSPHQAVGLFAGAMWFDLARAGWLPPIDPDVDDAIDGVDLLIFPIGVVWSTETERLGLDLTAGWDQVWVTGRPSSEIIILDGAIGLRRASLAAQVRVGLGARSAVGVRGMVPLVAMGRSVAVAELHPEEGVIIGVRSSDWTSLPAGQTATSRIYLEYAFKRSFLRAGAATSAGFRSVGIPAIPYLLWSMTLSGG